MALTDNLVEYWDLDEASGNAVGAHASLDLTDTNTVTQAGGPGGVGNSRQFTAANTEYFTRASEAALQVAGVSFTFSMWAYFDSTADNYRILIAKRNGSFYSYQVHYARTGEGPPGGGYLKMEYGVSGYGTIKNVVSSVSPSTATWYFIVAEFDYATGVMTLYVNDSTSDSSSSVGADLPTDSADPFQIGTDVAGVEDMDGRIARVGFWKRVLTSGERTQLYNSGAGLTYAEVAAAGSTTRGAPFGARGTAFNGGRTMMGLIR